MPSKRKRAASRQAKLSGRRKRRGGAGRRQRQAGQEGSGALVASPVASRRSATSTTEAVATQTQRPAAAAQPTQTQQRRARSVATAPMARTRASQSRAATYEPLPMYAYLGSELKRIGAITAIMAIALAALTVALG